MSKLSLPIKIGVYVGMTGPTYESAAEVRLLARLGGDAVGASTVIEFDFIFFL
jgi:purine-nucleoside phosphorylase